MRLQTVSKPETIVLMSASGRTSIAAVIQLQGKRLETARQFRCLLGALFGLIVADGVITIFLIERGLATEFNPFLADTVGGPVFMPLKMVGAAIGVHILWRAYRERPRLAGTCSMCLVAFYTLVVYWNAFLSVVAQV